MRSRHALAILGCSLLAIAAVWRSAAAPVEAPLRAEDSMAPVVFATYIESSAGLVNVRQLTESLREFGGRWRDAPLWTYRPEDVTLTNTGLMDRLRTMGVEMRTSRTPASARRFFYGGKPFAAAAAESAAEGRAAVLVWIDADALVFSEPTELDLAAGIGLAYCPVMHNRSGTLHGAAPDAFWSRIYELLSLTDDRLFPMVTRADRQTIRAYFHCGHLAVRPELGILRAWAADFTTLAEDSVLISMCEADQDKRIFLHQTALTGAVLDRLAREEMVQLSEAYNYPVFFDRQYGALQTYDSIDGVVTARFVVSLDRVPDWDRQITGPDDRIAWLKEHLTQAGE